MDFFFVQYRDPIFGLIVLVAAVLVVAMASWAWGVIGRNLGDKSIENIIKHFGDEGQNTEHLAEFLNEDELRALAHAMGQKADFMRAAALLLAALKKSAAQNRSQILTELGTIYLKSGLIERAKEAFLEAIRLKNKNTAALNKLASCYEKMHQYKEALAVLDALLEQDEPVRAQMAYIRALVAGGDIKEILKNASDFAPLKRLAATSAINKNELDILPPDALPGLNECVDLCYKNAEFAQKIEGYNELFEVRAIDKLNGAGIAAKLTFKYSCAACGARGAAYFYRCAACGELKGAVIATAIAPDISPAIT